MASIQNSITLPLMPPLSSQTPQEKGSGSVGVEPSIVPKTAAPGAEVSTLNNALIKADVLAKTLQTPTFKGEQKDDRVVAAQQFQNSLNGVANSGVPLTPEQKTALQQTFEQVSPQVRMPAPQLMADQKKTVEDKVLWEKIANAIGQINEEYLGVYENVVSNYTDFYTAYSDILSQMGSWITPGADGNKVKLDVGKLLTALNKLKTDYSLPNKAAVLFPTQSDSGGITGSDIDTAKQWAKELGLPESCVKPFNGNYVVVVDLTPVDTMIRDAGALGSGIVEMDNAKFQAWQSGFKAQEENLKNTLQTLTQKYSNANSLYDNLVKVLSSTISSCLETAKSFLQG
ncbi:type III secretion system needle tip protein SctA [Pluralibacter sp.]|jgi:invasin D|uniref:type III secretion system needle tip protein SctA n=1 Tax=Pluralibacter sp. TaxID=1920032 RepID=UPI0025DBC1CD|nr:type III secretion system needle tip protein SctA [Pluralibacter sp.]MBV8045294.1 type III secretion system needle tip protein SctA [Pluralibacter sp.]